VDFIAVEKYRRNDTPVAARRIAPAMKAGTGIDRDPRECDGKPRSPASHV